MNWKAIAIFFIILFTVETLTFGYLLYVGTNIVNDRYNCQSICANKDSDSFTYEEPTKFCECYKDNEVFYDEVLR